MDTSISSNSLPERICSTCGKPFPETSDYFRLAPTGRPSFDGVHLNPKCKICCNNRDQTYRDNNRDITRASSKRYRDTHKEQEKAYRERRKPYREPKEVLPEGMHRCSGPCQRVLEWTYDFFQKNPKNKNGLKGKCRECCNIQNKEYAEKNKEFVLASQKKYRDTHKEQEKETRRKWFEKHREEKNAKARRIRLEQKEQLNQRRRELYQMRDNRRITNAQRRARTRAVPGTYTEEDIQKKLKAQKYCCYYAHCGFSKFPKKKNGRYIYHIDHIIPIARPEAMPRNDIDYLVLTCGTCNMSKGKQLPHEWEGSGRLF